MIEKRFEIKDTLKCSALALALFGLAMYVPILSLLVCLVPAFIAVSTYRNSLKMGALGALIVVIGSFFLLGIMGLVISSELVGLGLLIGELMRRKIEPPYVIVFGAAFFVMTFIGGVLVSDQGSTQQILDTMLRSYEQALLSSGDIISNFGGEEYITALILEIRRVFPSFLLICGIVVAFINYYLTGYMLMKMYLKRQVPMFAEFSLPGQLFVAILSIGAMLLFMNYAGFIYYESLLINTMQVFSLLFYLQGLACAYNYLMTRMKPVVRNILMLVLIVFFPMYGIIQMIGFLDLGFNIRKLNR